MTWTDPRTWVTDELVTAALMNTHIRDNFNAVPHLLALKTADESVTSSTTLQDDNHLTVTLAANALWYLNLVLVMTGDSPTPSGKIAFTVPASATLTLSASWKNAGSTVGPLYWYASGLEANVFLIAQGSVINVQGIVETGATAGTFQVQFAQNASSATAVVMKKGSAIYGMQLA